MVKGRDGLDDSVKVRNNASGCIGNSNVMNWPGS
jgi:hypothetical protein